MTELDSIVSKLKAKLIETLQQQEGIRVDDVSVEKIVNRGFSTVIFIKLKTSAGERRMVAKKTVHHPANISITSRQNQAVVEFNILSELYPKYQTVANCSVPKPVLVVPEDEVFVMEFVEGKLLMEEFVAARYFSSQDSFHKLKQSYYQCGMWLKYFQKFTGVHQSGKEVINCTLERCDDKLKIIERSGDPRCPIGFRNRVNQLLLEQVSLVGDNLLVAGRHGDFGNWNVITGNNMTTVFDFLGYKLDLLPIDLIKMIINLEGEKSFLFYSSKRIDELKVSFLEGYGQMPNVPKPIFIICELLHRVCSVCSCIENKPESIKRFIEQNICIDNHLKWILDSNRKTII